MIASGTSLLKKLLLIFVIFAGLHFAREFLIPLTLGALLAMLFLPLCKKLENIGTPKVLAALTSVFILILIFTAIGTMLSWQISELSKDAAVIKQQGKELLQRTQEFIHNNLGIAEDKQIQLLSEQQSALTGAFMSIVASLPLLFTGSILMMVYIVLLLYYRTHIKEFFLKISPAGQRKEMEHLVFNAASVSQQYLLGLIKMIACLWVMYSIGFGIVGVKNFVFFAIICGLLEIIPFIGNLTGTTITILVSLAQGANVVTIVGIIITYGTVQFIQGWILEPLIVGHQVRINPLFTILALVIGELVWGIPGVILAIPITAMLKIVCDHVEPMRPYGFLIGEIARKKDEKSLPEKIKELFSRK